MDQQPMSVNLFRALRAQGSAQLIPGEENFTLEG
jgi:hypothetical protein